MKLASNVYSACIKAVIHFEQEHASTITDYNFKLRDLVLIQNTTIERSLNHKMHARYIGPLIIILRNWGGAYIISELNSSVFNRPIATFCVIPYFTWQHINIPPLDKLINITLCWLHELEETTLSDPNEEDEDFATNRYPSPDVDNDDEGWGQSSFQLGGEILGNFFILTLLCLCLCTYIHFCSYPFATSPQLWLSKLQKRFYWQWSILSLSSFIIFANLFGLTNYLLYFALLFFFRY